MIPTWFAERKALPIAIVTCIILAIIIVKTRPSMQHQLQQGFISSVNVIKIKQYMVKPAIKGFGVVRAIGLKST